MPLKVPIVNDDIRRAPLKVHIAGMPAQDVHPAPQFQQAPVTAAAGPVGLAERQRWALLAEENRLLRSRVEHARLAQDNALLRLQLLQHHHWQTTAMYTPPERTTAPLPTDGARQQRSNMVSRNLRSGSSFGMENQSFPPPASPGISSTAPFSNGNKGIQRQTQPPSSGKTTCMLRNLPNPYTRENLLDLLDKFGFQGKYSFVYLPMDFKTDANLGYAFVDMVTPEEAELLHMRVQGFSDWAPMAFSSEKVCEVAWSDALQGLDAHIERYRNSPVMHESVPTSFKPLVFVNGNPVPFPAPTKKIRPPRQWVRKR